jgi:hypothetical protein
MTKHKKFAEMKLSFFWDIESFLLFCKHKRQFLLGKVLCSISNKATHGNSGNRRHDWPNRFSTCRIELQNNSPRSHGHATATKDGSLTPCLGDFSCTASDNGSLATLRGKSSPKQGVVSALHPDLHHPIHCGATRLVCQIACSGAVQGYS